MKTSKISIAICALVMCAPLTMLATDTPAQAAARAQVEAKLREMEADPATTSQPTMAPMMNAPVVSTPTPAPTMSSSITTTNSEPMMNPVKKKKVKVQPTPVVTTPAPAVVIPVMPTTMNAGTDIGLKPITAPDLPIAASKEARLQALLVKYQADQITPEDYHKQRAAILAEP